GTVEFVERRQPPAAIDGRPDRDRPCGPAQPGTPARLPSFPRGKMRIANYRPGNVGFEAIARAEPPAIDTPARGPQEPFVGVARSPFGENAHRVAAPPRDAVAAGDEPREHIILLRPPGGPPPVDAEAQRKGAADRGA